MKCYQYRLSVWQRQHSSLLSVHWLHLCCCCSLKHPAKYIGKKPRKYTIPAKPLGPQGDRSVVGHQASDQVRIYKESSPNNGNTDVGGVGVGMMHLHKYQRVRLGSSWSHITLSEKGFVSWCTCVGHGVVPQAPPLLYCLLLPLCHSQENNNRRVGQSFLQLLSHESFIIFGAFSFIGVWWSNSKWFCFFSYRLYMFRWTWLTATIWTTI